MTSLIDLTLDHLGVASAALLSSLSKVIADTSDGEPVDLDPITPMAAALRAIGMAEGVLEAMKEGTR